MQELETILNKEPSVEPCFNEIDREVIRVLKQEATEIMGSDDLMEILEKAKDKISIQKGELSVESEIRRIKIFLNDIVHNM